MILGLSTFTFVHVVLSIIELVAGIVVVLGLLGSRSLPGWTALFVLTAVATSVTGFGFHTDMLLPSQILGGISLAVLLVVILARYVFHFAGAWRWIYAVSVVLSLYSDVFVAIVQAFAKIPSLNALAPTQSEPPFAYAQGAALLLFAVLAILAAVRFHPGRARP
jgi:hypothetical protein